MVPVVEVVSFMPSECALVKLDLFLVPCPFQFAYINA
jgi:hypothetical protein